MDEQRLILKPLDQSSKAALLGGTPLATVTVWCLDNFFVKPRGLEMEPSVTVAFGIIGAVFFGEVWLIFTNIAKLLLEKLK